MIKMYIGLHVQYPWLSDFNETWQTDGRTGTHDKDNSYFSQFCERAYKLVLNHRRHKLYPLRRQQANAA